MRDIQVLTGAPDTIDRFMSHADDTLQKAQMDLEKTAAAMQDARTCYDASVVQYDASTVAYDQSSMQYVQSEEQYGTGQVNGQISMLAADYQKLQSAEGSMPSFAPSSPTAAQVQSAEQSANGAIAQADKTMAGYLAKVQNMVNQANAYANAATKQHC